MGKQEQNQKNLKYLKLSQMKDKLELDTEKEKFIKEITGLNKNDLFLKQKSLTLWQRIKRVLNF